MVVSGRDGASVERAAAAITTEAKRLPTLAQVTSTAELDRPELRIIPDPERAAMLGVSTEAIAEAIRIATIGDNTAALAKFNAGDRLIPIRVQLPDPARSSRSILEALRVPTATGQAVPLSSVAQL